MLWTHAFNSMAKLFLSKHPLLPEAFLYCQYKQLHYSARYIIWSTAVSLLIWAPQPAVPIWWILVVKLLTLYLYSYYVWVMYSGFCNYLIVHSFISLVLMLLCPKLSLYYLLFFCWGSLLLLLFEL